ncbi:hypothetical protein [Nocardia blacklockiae]|uniref:hypothetical protein n=1 Tax=Nocardia blacklockiae TaxID=480036 RepID=UPI00189378F7|nr:hypothetical protein [Nocardia blacklockiae]MBF6175056.1 hypothetical protein [Nocardia blacklockiae]
MDLEEISGRAAELATLVGAPTPHVAAGKVPNWSLGGIQPRFRKRQPVLVIGSAFGTLSADEQWAALAGAVATLGVLWETRHRPVVGTLLVVSVPYLVLSFLGGGVDGSLEIWQWADLGVIVHIVGFVVAQLLWTRTIACHVDRRIAEVLGRELSDLVLDLDERSRARARGITRMLLWLTLPSRSRRERALSRTRTAS